MGELELFDKKVGRVASPIQKLKRKKLIAFGWYGGKFSHLEWLLPLLPNERHYCEPFAIVAAAYHSVQDKFGEKYRPLEAHNAADSQTGSLGDVEITLQSDDKIVTVYEMKDKRVLRDDIDRAIQKLAGVGHIDNYIFITTDIIEDAVLEYAKSKYNEYGVEFAVLDCLGFIRHFLHFFHRYRMTFIDIYQEMVLREPTSSVSDPLKEAWLALRAAAEA